MHFTYCVCTRTFPWLNDTAMDITSNHKSIRRGSISSSQWVIDNPCHRTYVPHSLYLLCTLSHAQNSKLATDDFSILLPYLKRMYQYIYQDFTAIFSGSNFAWLIFGLAPVCRRSSHRPLAHKPLTMMNSYPLFRYTVSPTVGVIMKSITAMQMSLSTLANILPVSFAEKYFLISLWWNLQLGCLDHGN